jgi:hypothetical protein
MYNMPLDVAVDWPAGGLNWLMLFVVFARLTRTYEVPVVNIKIVAM